MGSSLRAKFDARIATGVLEEEIAKAGEAYLVCNSMLKVCANPVKVFIGASRDAPMA